QGESIILVERNSKGRVLTVLTPFRATDNTRGVNCLECHNVTPGAVNGAIRVSYSLQRYDDGLKKEVIFNIVSNLFFSFLGLILINLLITKWVVKPIDSLMRVVNLRAQGNISARADIHNPDELGKLADGFNIMADNVDASIQRELANAADLQQKVDELLTVVNRVTDGDFHTKISFSGDDSIGELAGSLQIMIDYIRISIDEKKQTVEELKQKVDKILSLVTQVSHGDLTQGILIQGDDAIAQLAVGVQAMTDSLNDLVVQIQLSMLKVGNATNEIQTSIRQVESNAVTQANNTNQIASNALNISNKSRELLTTMDSLSRVTEEAAKSAQTSHSGLAGLEELMTDVGDAVENITFKLNILRDKASNINSVVTLIGKIADQTNLLSLNASIEAEKAGEYGRGFGVVAGEIRRLADQTAVSTLDIEQIIVEMQQSVTDSVASMLTFSSQVQAIVSQVQGVSQQQALIIDKVETIAPKIETVHQVTREQSMGANKITDAITLLNNSAQETVTQLQSSSRALHFLSDAESELQQSIARFRVNGRRQSDRST
ncbi:MAG: methyl-accepting chemotaxis protein, partial [Gammaproteobacteria bacterium]|nr:methyl-accepting chemotaxis protein [Gammaproteobacteria bacterium]